MGSLSIWLWLILLMIGTAVAIGLARRKDKPDPIKKLDDEDLSSRPFNPSNVIYDPLSDFGSRRD
jgi:hypothetical protein